jgi:hypothetical protein
MTHVSFSRGVRTGCNQGSRGRRSIRSFRALPKIRKVGLELAAILSLPRSGLVQYMFCDLVYVCDVKDQLYCRGYDRNGSSASCRCALDARGMSAMPPIPTELMLMQCNMLREFA